MPLALSPENPCQTWGPRAEFRVYIEKKPKFWGPPFEPLTLAQLAGSASVLPRFSPPTPSRCYPVALGLKPRESVSNLGMGPTGQISYFNRTERNVRGSAVRAPDLGPTSRKCQCASQGAPLMPTRCNPVALGFKLENTCQTWDPRAEFRVFNRIKTKVLGSAVRALDHGPTSGKCKCAS